MRVSIFRDTSTFGDRDRRHTANSGYELIAFDAEKLNVFAAEVRYCEPHWHPAPELITVLSGRFSIVVGQQSVEMVEGHALYQRRGGALAACGSGEGVRW